MESIKLKHGLLNICANAEELVRRMAERVVIVSRESIAERERFMIALSGGSTPETLYQLLANPRYSNQIDWRKTHIFFGDERCVPPDHPDSNYRMANTTLLSKVAIPSKNVHRVNCSDSDPKGSAVAYEESVRDVFATPPDVVPQFDLILLGLGPEGHTASLFPENPDSLKSPRLVETVYVEKFQSHRVTFTLKLINHARNVAFVVSGKGKEDILPEVLKSEPVMYPAQQVVPLGNLEWFVDVDAASRVDKGQLART
jgi:6-phosphogluconolactonase